MKKLSVFFKIETRNLKNYFLSTVVKIPDLATISPSLSLPPLKKVAITKYLALSEAHTLSIKNLMR